MLKASVIGNLDPRAVLGRVVGAAPVSDAVGQQSHDRPVVLADGVAHGRGYPWAVGRATPAARGSSRLRKNPHLNGGRVTFGAG